RRTLNEIAQEAKDNAVAHGFVDHPFSEHIALIHSELSEALECYRTGEPLAWLNADKGNKPEGIGPELAVPVRLRHRVRGYGWRP
ncbi:MAG: hypothetical protein ACREQ5_16000, partial [Candidatus Dormibacteria bacterium]